MTTPATVTLTPLAQFAPCPGQRLVLLSPGCASAAHAVSRAPWPALDGLLREQTQRRGALCVVALPSDLDEATTLALCRAAHEVWVLEADTCPISHSLRAFRTQSAPPSLNERRSVLQAPEVGIIRVWSTSPTGIVEQLTTAPHSHLSARAVEHMQLLYNLLAQSPCKDPDDWACMGQILRSHAARRRRLVRWTLSGLFALTFLGAIGLQWLSMSPWRIPMADLYAVFYLTVGSLYLWGKRQQWNTEQLAWMSLAEALESQALLGRAGFRHGAITGLFLLRHRRSVEWIREALRPMTWALFTQHATQTDSSLALLRAWVPRALERHRDVAERQRRKSLALEWGMRTCYAVGAVLTVVAITGWVSDPAAFTAVSLGIGLSSALGTLMLIFNGVLGFAQDAELHAHLAGVFAQAERCLDQPMSAHEYDELLLDLVQETVQQSAERVLL